MQMQWIFFRIQHVRGERDVEYLISHLEKMDESASFSANFYFFACISIENAGTRFDLSLVASSLSLNDALDVEEERCNPATLAGMTEYSSSSRAVQTFTVVRISRRANQNANSPAIKRG